MKSTSLGWIAATKKASLKTRLEASTGFEPVMRVLQTLALPLGHDAGEKTRAGDGIRTHDLLLGKETFYQLNHARVFRQFQAESAESQNRTGDTAIFSRVLYQLSYLGLST